MDTPGWQLFTLFLTLARISGGSSLEILTGQNSYCGNGNKASPSGYEPWSALIFTRPDREEPWEYVGEGTLITNTTVLSSAEIFVSKSQRKLELNSFDNYVVVLGLDSSRLPDKLDPFSDFSLVSYIRFHERTLESVRYSLAVLHLSSQLIYSSLVNEICVPQNHNSATFGVQVRAGDLVRMGGYQRSGDNPFAPPSPHKGHRAKIRQFLVKDTNFCIKNWNIFQKWVEMPQGLQCVTPSGSDWWEGCQRGTAVLVSQSEGSRNTRQYFMVGIFVKYFEVNKSTDLSKCTTRSTYFFIDIFQHLQWIYDNIRCGGSKFACTSTSPGPQGSSPCVNLLGVCDGRRDCDNGQDEGVDFCKTMTKCPSGYHRSIPFGPCDNKVHTFHTQVEELDSANSSTNTKVRCTGPHVNDGLGTNGSYPCTTGGQLGSKMLVQCDKFYTSQQHFSTLQMQCLESGQWFPETQFTCKIDCGRGGVSGIRPLVVNGWATSISTWPWHGKLCQKTSDGIDCICGATLISTSVALTAAHCLIPNQEGRVDPSGLELIFGTSDTDYYDAFNKNKGGSVQRFQVKEVLIHESFNPRSFEGDIAVIHLSRNVILTDFVRPVCFPFPGERSSWLEAYQLVPGVIGYVAGFGISESGDLPLGLRAVGLPYVSHSECSGSLERSVFPSQFCAGYRNGSGTCNGDSGGGIVFAQGTGAPSAFYIQGIVSNSAPLNGTYKCNHQNYSVFTKVSDYAQWIMHLIHRFKTP